MTAVAGSSQLQTHKIKSRDNSSYDSRIVTARGKSKSKTNNHHHGDSESDTSCSPTNEFSNAPTYRIPVKSARGETIKGVQRSQLILYLIFFRYVSSRFQYRIK